MSKLLNKPFKAFTIYALIILACSIPVYYVVVDSIWLEELDEHNHIIKTRIEQGVAKIDFEESGLSKTLEAWNSIQPGTKLVPSDSVKNESYYTITRFNEYEHEMDRFRGLSSYIQINGKPYHLTVETNVEEADETLLAIAFVTFLFFSLLVIGFVVLNKRISKKIWLPFRSTLERLKDFDLNKHKNISFEKTDIEEFEELNTELSRLIENNISAFHQQKSFIENASHELQTPLAVLRTKIDTLIQSKDLTAEQSAIITTVNDNLSRISRINKNLLLLAKIENNQFLENENINIDDALNESLELLSVYFEEKSIDIKKNIHTQSILSCNKTLFEILVNNLLVNAIRHNTGNSITVQLDNGVLLFSNPGEQALNNDSLFKRFTVSSSENTNSGLGLSIVKEICNRYNWQISYTFSNKLHSFSIKF